MEKGQHLWPDINKMCGNPICTNLKCERLIKPSFAPLDEIKAFLNLHSLEGTFALCQKCYCYAYNVLHPKETRKSCGAVSKAGEIFNRHIPDPQTITEHFRNTIDNDINITPQDVLCLSCYKVHSHNIIIKELKNPCIAGADDTLQHKMHE